MQYICFSYEYPNSEWTHKLSGDETIDGVITEIAEKIADIWIGFMKSRAHTSYAIKQYKKASISCYQTAIKKPFPTEIELVSFKTAFIQEVFNQIKTSCVSRFCIENLNGPKETSNGPKETLSKILQEANITQKCYPKLDKWFPYHSACYIQASYPQRCVKVETCFYNGRI